MKRLRLGLIILTQLEILVLSLTQKALIRNLHSGLIILIQIAWKRQCFVHLAGMTPKRIISKFLTQKIFNPDLRNYKKTVLNPTSKVANGFFRQATFSDFFFLEKWGSMNILKFSSRFSPKNVFGTKKTRPRKKRSPFVFVRQSKSR